MTAANRRLSRRWNCLLPLLGLLPMAGCATDSCHSCGRRPVRDRALASGDEACLEEPWQAYAKRLAARPQPAFFGFQHTCWHEFPAGGPNCEPCQTAWGVDTPLIGPFPDLPLPPGAEPIQRPAATQPPEEIDSGTTDSADDEADSAEMPPESRSPVVVPDEDESASAAPAQETPALDEPIRPVRDGRAAKKVTIISPPDAPAVVAAGHDELRTGAVERAFVERAFAERASAELHPVDQGVETLRQAPELTEPAESDPSADQPEQADQAALRPAAHEPRTPRPTVIALRVGPPQIALTAMLEPVALADEGSALTSDSAASSESPTTDLAQPPADSAHARAGSAHPPTGKKPVRIVRIVRQEPKTSAASAEPAPAGAANRPQPTRVELSPPKRNQWRSAQRSSTAAS